MKKSKVNQKKARKSTAKSTKRGKGGKKAK